MSVAGNGRRMAMSGVGTTGRRERRRGRTRGIREGGCRCRQEVIATRRGGRLRGSPVGDDSRQRGETTIVVVVIGATAQFDPVVIDRRRCRNGPLGRNP